ncbi:MAG: hypothetical protein WA584_09145 [Pyrinomonadaceae bacterium]
MNKENVLSRINSLIEATELEKSDIYELFNGTLNILNLLHGENSQVVKFFITEFRNCKTHDSNMLGRRTFNLLKGTLKNLKDDFQAGLIGNFQLIITGEVLSDFLQLARKTLLEKGEDAKNVSAVLSAALFEDTIRRLAVSNGIPHIDKLQDVVTELKKQGILQGSQIGIANSYLNFRNNSLHAQWDKVDRPEIQSILAFTEGLLLKHFS